ncbi:serine hydrolase domain-containing protein [Qipengyuania flava]|uniref:serine hydrolase domain-containing protein n=1 Tax=Qipengyuania flava TaxID=192812 RepID=UPI001C62B0CD|nr:serine hydrolase domain-containing protein [Qipengyuania flava]QYJ06521.1 beta-lactamase family protein [Qipengyuania flava]
MSGPFGKPLASALALLLASSPALAEGPAKPLTATEKEAAVREKAPVWLAEFDVPSVGIAYIEDGEIAWVRHFGFQQWGYPANEETLYNVASLTKPVTAEIVMRYVEAGTISLDMKLADHHVEEDVANDPRIHMLTPRLVMNHRTGFTNWRYQTDDVLQFSRDPDTETEYSGEGYEWMMKAVEKATGEDWVAASRALVFDPIGMKFTSYTRTKYFAHRTALPYKAGEPVFDRIHSEPIASDDMRTTAREYARFLLDVWEGDAVSPGLRQQQRTIKHYLTYKPACKGEEKAAFCPVNEGWGLGWFIYQWDDRTVIEHSGGDVGEVTIAFYDPDAKRGAVILTNGANGSKVIDRLIGVLDGEGHFADYVMSPY